MPTRSQTVLAAVIATLVLAAAPASAVTIQSSGASSASQKALAKAERRAAKQARKLAKQCARLGSKKMNAAKRAQLQTLCAAPANTPGAGNPSGPGVATGDGPSNDDENAGNGTPGGGVDIDDHDDEAVDHEDVKVDHEDGTVDQEQDWDDEGDLADVTDPIDTGDDDPGDLLAEILETPPLFTPPPGGESPGDAPQTRHAPQLDEDDDEGSHDVPEPGSLALLGIGLVGLGLARRRRRVPC